MSQRLIAAVVAGPLVAALLLLATFMPLPYVIYRPGLTIDVLGEQQGREIVRVDGAPSYYDGGELRMTTVTVTPPRPAEVNLLQLMTAWADDENAVIPYDSVYRPDETPEENDRQGAIQMVSSQDTAIAVALTELDYEVKTAIEVQAVDAGSPAEGRLQVRDIVEEVNGTKVKAAEDIGKAVAGSEKGTPVQFLVKRGDLRRRISIVPETIEGEQRVGISIGLGFDLPVDVKVNIPENISGPSAGLMFSLATYDTLTPGSLTDGEIVAGTGEIRPDGSVGPIGGIDQKIAGAERDGARLFLVPPDNCPDVEDVDPGSMQLVLAETMHTARLAIEAWAQDRDADLPTCADLDRREAAGAGAGR